MSYEPLDQQIAFRGSLLDVRIERFRHADGEEVSREIVHHQGAVGVLVLDEHQQIVLVRQPREAIGATDLLEIPAGRLDVPGESPLACAKRELAEEVGLGAGGWEPIISYYSSPGFTDELVHLYYATELSPVRAESSENERIQIVHWPAQRIDQAIETSRDAKTIIALQWLQRRLKS